MTTGVLLMTYGAPRGDEDVAAYLGRVRGHPPAPELVDEMRRRYPRPPSRRQSPAPSPNIKRLSRIARHLSKAEKLS